MKYVALLRGINVGGNSRVEMSRLKAVFEVAGMGSVKTYINSGNVVFTYDKLDSRQLAELLEDGIEHEFGFRVNVLVKSMPEIEAAVDVTPSHWHNGTTMKCDVVFLWGQISAEAALSELKARDGVDEVRSAPGVIIWKVDRENATRNGLLKMAGTPLYKQVTIRNINTVRKILELLNAIN